MNNENEMTEEEEEKLKAAARRSMAYSLLPSILRSYEGSEKDIVKRAYKLADEMIKQGE